MRKATPCLTAAVLIVVAISAGCGASLGSGSPSATARPTSAPTPTATPIPPAVSWMAHATLLTIYGRAFGVAPILGRLGMDSNFRDLAAQVQPFLQGVRANNGGKKVRVVVHLIYAIATPCSDAPKCLIYLDDTGVDIVKQYIEPAARRGWLVILDDQLGSSTPLAEVRRMAQKGYLRYDNVGIALDPEFRAQRGQPTPGIPVGWVTAGEINLAEHSVSRYVHSLHPRHRKLLVIHQFRDFMIEHRGRMQVHVPNVDIAIIMDGFGDPGVKAHVYSDLLALPVSRRIQWRGIKLFYPNPEEAAGHGDDPLMTWPQVFGHSPAWDVDGRRYFVRPEPSIVIIA